MDARDDPVELGENLVVVVERAVRKHVDLAAGEQLDPFDLGRPDPLDVLAQPVGGEVIAEAEAGGVVGDRQVLVARVARGDRHLLDRGGAV